MTTEREKKTEDDDADGPWLPEGVLATEEAEDLDEAEAGPGDEDDDEDEDDDLVESYGADLEAPWAPVPRGQAREFLKANPAAKLDLVFPEAYAEDRSAKLKDLAVAQGLDYFTHQRAATQAAQEFGFEQFDYHAEMHAIRQEKKEWGDILGQGDALAGRMAGIPTLGAPSVLAPPDEDDLTPPRRADLAGPARAEFRKQQRESFAELAATVKALNESVDAATRRLAEAKVEDREAFGVELGRQAAQLREVGALLQALREAKPAVVNVTVPERPVEVHVEPPAVTVHLEPRRRTLTTERDSRGLITKITEEEAGGPDRAD